jgi:23S rRNA pseudouridine955/2504/2580 synthase
MSDSSVNAPGKGVRHLIVDEESSGQRLDNFLTRELKGVPRTRLYRALRKGEVRVNKGRVRASYRLVPGDLVRIPPLYQSVPTEAARTPPRLAKQIEQRVVHEDDNLLVID